MLSCSVCGEALAAQRSTRRFCSDGCRQKHHRDRRNGKPHPVTRRGRELNAIIPLHPLAERGHDLYETPTAAVQALLDAEPLPVNIWEPACGRGAMVRVLRAAGHHVVATDLVDYDSPDQDAARIDFLMEQFAPAGIECIATNPPFSLAEEFAAHALRLCPRVILLARLAFLAELRPTGILDGGQLARILVFKNRLPMMHRDGWPGRKIEKSALPFAWFIWDRDHRGAAAVERISWQEMRPGAKP